MKKGAAFSRLQKIACATCLLLFLCSCKAGQPRAVSSEAPAGLSESDRNALVEKYMPPPDRWQESYAALPEEQQNEVQDWLVWYAARSDEDKKMLSYRPWGFGCFSEADVAAVMAEQDGPAHPSVFRRLGVLRNDLHEKPPLLLQGRFCAEFSKTFILPAFSEISSWAAPAKRT